MFAGFGIDWAGHAARSKPPANSQRGAAGPKESAADVPRPLSTNGTAAGHLLPRRLYGRCGAGKEPAIAHRTVSMVVLESKAQSWSPLRLDMVSDGRGLQVG